MLTKSLLTCCWWRLLQPGPAGVPQHDALLQAVDAGVLGSVADHLAGPAAARKVRRHTKAHIHTQLRLHFILLCNK